MSDSKKWTIIDNVDFEAMLNKIINKIDFLQESVNKIDSRLNTVESKINYNILSTNQYYSINNNVNSSSEID